MSDTEEPPLSPTAAGAGCGVMAGASLMTLLFLAQGFLGPLVASAVGVKLSGQGWIAFAVGTGLVAAVGIGFASARAFKHPLP